MRKGLLEPQTVWRHLVERRSCHPVAFVPLPDGVADATHSEFTEQFRMIGGSVPVAVGTSEVPIYVRASLAYANETIEYFEPDLFRGIKLEPPPNYTKLVLTTEEKLKDVVRGRRPLSDVDRIVDDWWRAGGDDGRASFERGSW